MEDNGYKQAIERGKRVIEEADMRGDHHDFASCWLGNGRRHPALRVSSGYRIISCSNNYETPCSKGLGKLYPKYDVKRLGDKKGKHATCRYFVLDPRHDEHARTAIKAYAEAVAESDPQLAQDLYEWIEKEENRGR